MTPTDRQLLFLAYPAREILFGGAAGGGKSAGILMAALQYVEVPGYAALLLRRSFADLELPKALIPLSHEWLRGTKAEWNGLKHQWLFPAGSTLNFGYLETEGDKFRYQSSAFQFIGFDEASQFLETQYVYLFSRCRKPKGMPVPLRNRAGSNPGGVGSTWLKQRFLSAEAKKNPQRAFIPSRLEDNPYLDREEYEKSLNELDPVTRAQLRWGDWDIAASGVFKQTWFRYYRTEGGCYRLIGGNGDKVFKIEDCILRFATVDVAGTEKLKPSSDPDYTVCQVWDLTPDYDLILVDQWRDRKEIPDVEDELIRIARKYDLNGMYVEHAGVGLGVFQTIMRRGIGVRPLRPKGKSKLQRSHIAQSRMQGGSIYFPLGQPWVSQLETELLQFTGQPDSGSHDDQVDTLSYAAIVAQQHGGALANEGDTSPSMTAADIEIQEEHMRELLQTEVQSREGYWEGADED